MALTRNEVIVLVGAFGAAILTGLIHIGVREWYQADIRYEEGPYYISGQTAVTSLKLTNRGRSDADELAITVRFDSPVKDVSLDSRSLALNIVGGGIGYRFVTARLDRLVPNQQVSLFIAVENQNIRNDIKAHFIEELTFKGGHGKTGEPLLTTKNISFSFLVVMQLLTLFVMQRQFLPHYGRLSYVMDLAVASFYGGKDRVLLESEIDTWLNKEKITFRKETLKEVALRCFDSLLQNRSGEEKTRT